jgi:hypothetical protein
VAGRTGEKGEQADLGLLGGVGVEGSAAAAGLHPGRIVAR